MRQGQNLLIETRNPGKLGSWRRSEGSLWARARRECTASYETDTNEYRGSAGGNGARPMEYRACDSLSREDTTDEDEELRRRKPEEKVGGCTLYSTSMPVDSAPSHTPTNVQLEARVYERGLEFHRVRTRSESSANSTCCGRR
jgi:hypothetical protein